MNKVTILLLVILTLLILTGCMAGSGRNTPQYRAGFFSGIWHGWIAPISLVVSLFNNNIRIYEVNNTGFWYDFGFYIAVISGFGGVGLFRKRNHKGRH